MAEGDNRRKLVEILRTLEEADEPLGAKRVADAINERGFSLGERAVRYYLRILDERDLTEKHGYSGRTITEKGREELSRGLVSERIGFVISRIEDKIYSSNFDLDAGEGDVVVNTTFVPEEDETRALDLLRNVFDAGLGVSSHVSVAGPGEDLAGKHVPEGQVGIATLCSITIDGVLLKQGIPVTPRFGGLVEVSGGDYRRFTDVISYEGSSVDPVEVFLKTGMTSVTDAMDGYGNMLGNLRGITRSARGRVQEVVQQLEELGIGGVMEVGKPNQPVLGIPVERDRFGLAMVAGINAAAALHEAGIKAPTEEISGLLSFEDMEPL